jgi:hypothetical protein
MQQCQCELGSLHSFNNDDQSFLMSGASCLGSVHENVFRALPAGAPHIILKLVQVDADDISKRVHWKVRWRLLNAYIQQ